MQPDEDPINWEKLFDVVVTTLGMTRDEEIEFLSSDEEPERARDILLEVLSRKATYQL